MSNDLKNCPNEMDKKKKKNKTATDRKRDTLIESISNKREPT